MTIDTTEAVYRSDAERLARVFALAEDETPLYSPDELGPILRHQLETSVEFDLSTLSEGTQRLLRAAAVCGPAGGVRTFRELFFHPDPPVQLLLLTKDFAKSHLSHPGSPLPPEIASVLYYTSIVVAWVRVGKRITTLSEAELVSGLDQVLAQDWLDEGVRRLLAQGRDLFEARRRG